MDHRSSESEFEDTLGNADTVSISVLNLEAEIENERVERNLDLKSLSEKVCHFHTNMIYYRHASSLKGEACINVWRTLVKQIGCTDGTWQDLGSQLGLARDDLYYIQNSIKEVDKVDIVLKVFIENRQETATLDKVIDALVKMNRYDILNKLETPLHNLIQCFNREDSGYHSEKEQKDLINFAKYQSELPAVLSKNVVINKPKEPTKKPVIKEIEKILNDSPILFLTFAEDGLETALNIKNYVDSWSELPDVTVLVLNDRREEVYRNPEKYIREYFEKADYIVPILTSGYLNRIQSHTMDLPSTTDNLDFKYVNFIYNLISNYYIHGTGCLNTKVRSVIPRVLDINLHKNLGMYPHLMPYTHENSFSEQFKVFLKA